MQAGRGRNLIIAGAVLLLLGVIVGFAFSFLLGVLLILASVGAFGYQAAQSAKAAKARENDSAGDDDSEREHDSEGEDPEG